MKKLLLVLPFVFMACGKKAENVSNQTANQDTTQTAQVDYQRTIKDYFEVYKSKNIPQKDTLIITENTDKFVQFSHAPTEGEIIGVTYISLNLLRIHGETDKILYFSYGCVEGNCNLELSSLKVYTTDWQDITQTVINKDDIQKLFDQKLTALKKDANAKEFDSVFAIFDPDTDTIKLQIIKSDDENIMQGKNAIDTRALTELSWDNQAKKLVPQY